MTNFVCMFVCPSAKCVNVKGTRRMFVHGVAHAIGNAGVSSVVIFGSVTACQWLQMRRKGRL